MNTYHSPMSTGASAQSDVRAYEANLPVIPVQDFQLTDYGAVGDGVTDNTEMFRLAIASCAEAGGGRIVIPAGVWLTGPIVMRAGSNYMWKKGHWLRLAEILINTH